MESGLAGQRHGRVSGATPICRGHVSDQHAWRQSHFCRFSAQFAIASDVLPPVYDRATRRICPGWRFYHLFGFRVRLANVQYQWQFNGTNITGATNATLTLTGVESANAGSYQVVVSSGGRQPPVSPPLSVWLTRRKSFHESFCPGVNWIVTNTTLSVSMNQVGASQYPLSYQWQFNGTNIVSATNSNYTLFNPVPTNEGNYTVVITNSLGTNSATWALRVAFPGMVEAWGSDGSGEIDRPVSLTNAAAIVAGDYHSVRSQTSGIMVQWGRVFRRGRFYSVTNTTVASLPPDIERRGRDGHGGLGQALALKSDGTVTKWGLGPPLSPITCRRTSPMCQGRRLWLPIQSRIADQRHALAWGYGGTNGSLTNVPSQLPTPWPLLRNAHSVALIANGRVIGWGYNPAGETNVPAGSSNVVAIAAGRHHNLALNSNGIVVAGEQTISARPTCLQD